jgi:hypothetical protein
MRVARPKSADDIITDTLALSFEIPSPGQGDSSIVDKPVDRDTEICQDIVKLAQELMTRRASMSSEDPISPDFEEVTCV